MISHTTGKQARDGIGMYLVITGIESNREHTTDTRTILTSLLVDAVSKRSTSAH